MMYRLGIFAKINGVDKGWCLWYHPFVVRRENMKPSRFLCIGPGGRKCSCCFPAPGSKARKAEYRRAKRRFENETRKIVKDENDEAR
jgi:hypothetical protein